MKYGNEIGLRAVYPTVEHTLQEAMKDILGFVCKSAVLRL